MLSTVTMSFQVVVFIFLPLLVTGQMNSAPLAEVPEVPESPSNLTVYNSSEEEFHACFKLESNKTICAQSSQTRVKIINGDGQVLFDVRDTPKYEFRRIGNISLVKFKNEKKEKRLLVNNFDFDSPEQVDPSYLADVNEKEFKKQAIEMMAKGHIDSMFPLADSIDKLDFNEEQTKAVRPILTLVMNALNVETTFIENGELKMDDSKNVVDRKHQRTKRYILCWEWWKKDPIGPTCLGLCGPHCLCWWHICGNCCYNHGCYEHDICCADFFSADCLGPLRLVFGFSCNGYPNCGKPPKSRGCFPAESTVQRKNSEATFLKDLRVGDEVLTMDDKGREVYTKVLTFIDHKPHLLHTYLRVKFTDGETLTISKRHLVFKQEGENTKIPVYALEVAVGDYLFKHSNIGKSLQAMQVVSIEETERYGAYAPLTEQGTLLVDGIFTSCYAEIRSHRLAHFAMTPLRLWKFWFPSKEVQHGIHSYAEHLQKGVEWFKPLLPKPLSDVFG